MAQQASALASSLTNSARCTDETGSIQVELSESFSKGRAAMTTPRTSLAGTNVLREVIAGIVDPAAKFQDIEGHRWSQFELERRELAYRKADSILSLMPAALPPESKGGMVKPTLMDPISSEQRISSDLLTLAERCEKATGPDRDLDGAIATEMGEARNYEGDGVYGCKRYTGSIDAAMTLVPEGYACRLDCWSAFTARVFLPEKKYHDCYSSASAALALCAAALRARNNAQNLSAEPVASDDASKLVYPESPSNSGAGK